MTMVFRLLKWAICIIYTASIVGCKAELEGKVDPQRFNKEEFPREFEDPSGKKVSLGDYRGKKLVMVVLRGVPKTQGGQFCPNCIAQATSFASQYREFQERQTEVIFVFPGKVNQVVDFTKQISQGMSYTSTIPFPICVDLDCRACDVLGIRGDLAKPSVFILNPQGEISYAYIGRSQSDRPTVKTILVELEQVK